MVSWTSVLTVVFSDNTHLPEVITNSTVNKFVLLHKMERTKETILERAVF